MKEDDTYNWKTVRVFISSTFRDFHAERDFLVKYVFPEVREWCLQWKLHLDDIDLRWGVTRDEAESGKVVDICLEHVDGCRPFFMSMLGSRYGWIPKKEDIPRYIYQRYEKLDKQKDCSVTHLEILHAVLDPLSSADTVETVPHAFFYFREDKSLPDPDTDADRLSGLSAGQLKEYADAFFEKDEDQKQTLATLKRDIRAHYDKLGRQRNHPQEAEERIYSYAPTFDPCLPNSEDDRLMGRFTRESLDDFGKRVKRDLMGAIGVQYKQRIETLSKVRTQDRLESELDLQELFVENRTRMFVGRQHLLDKLYDYVTGEPGKVLAVHGEPGSGKSALLARFYLLLTDAALNHPGSGLFDLVIPHFVGASPTSTSLHSAMSLFCEAIKRKFDIEEEVPLESNKLKEALPRFLSQCEGKTLLILDGLNQLEEAEHSHDLDWLPATLPPKVKIIASSVGGKTWDALSRKTDAILEVTSLNDSEKREIISKMPSVFCKTLDSASTTLLLNKKGTDNPLYLKVALDELRIFGSHEKLPAKIGELKENVVDLYIDVLNRLETDMEKEQTGNGKKLVERLFCLLECSRYGLTDKEIRELMADCDPLHYHAAIIRQMRDHFHYREELLDFYHRALSKAVRKKYFDEAAEE